MNNNNVSNVRFASKPFKRAKEFEEVKNDKKKRDVKVNEKVAGGDGPK